ncbi:MAG: excinuclease ABC subunit UvrA [Candidatus Pacebacteria bacterium]|nr:excinuclease ABC subunit UvrA [Candidatus Paceibacterota bacterium]
MSHAASFTSSPKNKKSSVKEKIDKEKADSKTSTSKQSQPSPLSPIEHILIKGAREHNLQNLDLAIPKNKLIVFSGISGSGKSSLAFDTLYAEGQRRYVESLSSYARQFLGGMSKPAVDQIEGLSPAISIDQKTTSHNPRSTVGTITEIYDYFRLLYARIGHLHCPKCDQEVAPQSIDQIVQQLATELDQRSQSQPVRLMILAPVIREQKGEFQELFKNLQQKGYQRVRIDGQVYQLSEELTLIKTNKHSIEVVLDRLTIDKKQLQDQASRQTLLSRLTQSLEQALQLADGLTIASFIKDQGFDFPAKPKKMIDRLFSEQLACSQCGISFNELEPRLFSFNSPQGACETCNGLGSLLKLEPEKMIAPGLTLSEGAIIPFARTLSHDTWWARLVKTVVADYEADFRRTAFAKMSTQLQQVLLHGSDKVYQVKGTNRQGRLTSIQQKFEGFINNLERRYGETDSDYVRKEIEKYMLQQTCPDCQGARLKDEALAVKFNDQDIAQITSLPIDQLLGWSQQLLNTDHLSHKEKTIGQSIIKEIVTRLRFLVSVGLEYLSLNREASTLAGGEAQRIRLASQIGTGLTGVLYILDEPTIGLHPRDNQRLIKTLKNLRNQGNTVIVVEHDREVMLAADQIVDFGPKAGRLGGQVVAQAEPTQLTQLANSLTGKYLAKKKQVSRPKLNKKNPQANGQAIKITGASHHNLKKLTVEFPLSKLTCITGVSGSGKSTLLNDTLYYQLAQHLGYKIDAQPGPVNSLQVPSLVKKLALIDQSPIGKTPRSNPATYTKVFDYIRKIFAHTKEAKIRGYKPGRFSFNVKGGRCEACKGEGQLKIEMQFLPDVYITCDVCNGARYNQETLQVTYQGKNISEVLNMEVQEANEFFQTHTTLKRKLKTLIDVGLGYIELGQPAPTLSGGEAQRVKLAKELSGRIHEHVVYLLDEPTTGLHFADVQNLLNVLHQLVGKNNTVIVIEHNLDIVKNADWIIDLGPEGGAKGGEVIATGTPAQLAKNTASLTGHYLQKE